MISPLFVLPLSLIPKDPHKQRIAMPGLLTPTIEVSKLGAKCRSLVIHQTLILCDQPGQLVQCVSATTATKEI
jgi:hypothetical protein